MEKLVELLNKFEKEKIIKDWWYVDEDDEYFWRSLEWWDIVNRSFDPDAHWFFKYQIISKDFEFIKRLCEKDLIDKATVEYSTDIEIYHWERWKIRINKPVEVYERAIMLLSIAENPIDLLISFLK